MAIVKAAVAADGIFAPPGEVAGLRPVVSEAAHHGINLKLVVIDHNPPNDPPLRDVATVVGSSYPDATVLVLSPSNVGSYSMNFPRSTLEIGEDNAKTGNAVVSAQNFLHQLVTPQFPWTGFTVLVLLGVLTAVVATRVAQVRAKRTARPTATDNAAGAGPSPAAI